MSGPDEMEQRLLQILRCPACGGSLRDEWEGAVCPACSTQYPRIGGTWRMLTAEQQAVYGCFMEGYAALRGREGWVRDRAYYLALPDVPPGDPAEQVWRIRRRSLTVVDRLLPPGDGIWALDLGAGCGWLSSYLAQCGYRPVAVDLNVGGADGLEGVQTYMDEHGLWIGRAQASMGLLPFASGTFAVCTSSAALHYAPLDETLREVHRVLRPGGMLLLTDSPVYRDPEAGRTMAAEQRARAQATLGSPPANLPGGEGYLVEDRLVDSLREAGFRARLVSTERLPGKLRRTVRDSLKHGQREHARFPVIVGEKV